MASKPSTRDESTASNLDALLRTGRWEEADRQLSPELPDQRLLSIAAAAYGLAGQEAPGDGTEFADRIAQAGTLEEALLTPHPPADCVFDLWDQVRLPGDDVGTTSCAAAAALAITRQLPLAAASLADILDIPNPGARCVFSLAVGRIARSSHATALTLVHQILSAEETDDWLRLAVLRGLGDGLLGDGLRRLTTRVSQSLDDHPAWQDAADPMANWAAANPSPEGTALQRAVLSRCLAEGETRERVVRWCHHARTAGRDEADLFHQLASPWTSLPAHGRAAMIRHAGETGLALEHDGLDEACGAALLAGLQRAGEAGRPPDRERLVDLCTHPDREIRGLAYQLLAPERSLGLISEARDPETAAEVVNLPVARITRSTLDRVRVMLSSGEAESIPSLAEGADEATQTALIGDLVAALDVPDMAVRRAAIESLGTLGDESAVPLLLEAARRLRGLAGMVVRAIRQIGELDDTEEIATLFDRRLRWADDEAVDDLVALAGDQAPVFLREVLHTRFYPPVRIGAARAMARHGMREMIFALRIRALTDPHADVREAAMEALKALTGSAPQAGEIAGYGPLTASVDALDEATERAAAAGTQALPGLRATLAKGTWRRRMAACKALSRLKGPESAEILYSALRDIDEDVRLAALLALKSRDWTPENATDRTLAAMAERRVDRLLNDDDELDVETLSEGLFLGGHLFRTEVGAGLSLLARQGDWIPGEEELAAWAVTRLEPHEITDTELGLEMLLQLIDRTWQVHPFRATLAQGLRSVSVPRLAQIMAQDGWRWRTREAVCRALARPACPEAPSLLSRFVLDPDEDVRSAALAALVVVGTQEAAACAGEVARSPFHDDAEAASAALAAMGESALEALADLATSPWWEARRLAALTYREWRGDASLAVDRVLVLAVDPEYRVAEAALEALRRHGRRPSREAILEILPGLQALTVFSILQWLPVDATGRLVDAQMREAVQGHVKALDDHRLPHALGVLSALKIHESIPWLDSLVGPGGTAHAGVRSSANTALAALLDSTCRGCHGKASLACVRCRGLGEEGCAICAGRGAVRQACPEVDCTATAPARAIGSPPCKTCRGRGFFIDPCSCGGGTVRCGLCQGTGSLYCPVCTAPRPEPEPEP
jgi:HEAT repeat protein